jgi:hypothetical protein
VRRDAAAWANKTFTENITVFLTASTAQGKLARFAADVAKNRLRQHDQLDFARAKCFDRYQARGQANGIRRNHLRKS